MTSISKAGMLHKGQRRDGIWRFCPCCVNNRPVIITTSLNYGYALVMDGHPMHGGFQGTTFYGTFSYISILKIGVCRDNSDCTVQWNVREINDPMLSAYDCDDVLQGPLIERRVLSYYDTNDFINGGWLTYTMRGAAYGDLSSTGYEFTNRDGSVFAVWDPPDYHEIIDATHNVWMSYTLSDYGPDCYLLASSGEFLQTRSRQPDTPPYNISDYCNVGNHFFAGWNTSVSIGRPVSGGGRMVKTQVPDELRCVHRVDTGESWASWCKCSTIKCSCPERVHGLPTDQTSAHTRRNPDDSETVLVRSGYCNAKYCDHYKPQ